MLDLEVKISYCPRASVYFVEEQGWATGSLFSDDTGRVVVLWR